MGNQIFPSRQITRFRWPFYRGRVIGLTTRIARAGLSLDHIVSVPEVGRAWYTSAGNFLLIRLICLILTSVERESYETNQYQGNTLTENSTCAKTRSTEITLGKAVWLQEIHVVVFAIGTFVDFSGSFNNLSPGQVWTFPISEKLGKQRLRPSEMRHHLKAEWYQVARRVKCYHHFFST